MSYTLSEIRRDNPRECSQLHDLLHSQGIALDSNLDYTCGLFDEDWNLVATGSTFGATLRCFAVSKDHQGEGLLNEIISHLMEYEMNQGRVHLFVYTKTSSAKFFGDLGFFPIAQVDGTLSFLENRPRGFAQFCQQLAQYRRPGTAAAVVMNANPFTLGHQFLVEQAASQFDTVHLFVLEEDASLVPFAVRWQLVQEGVAHLPNVICHKSGPYLISSATFPSYFLKDETTVIETHAKLDLALFGTIAQTLGISARVVGEEPSSVVTGLYNQMMTQKLPELGIQCLVLPRCTQNGQVVSASTVRSLIHQGCLEEIRPLVPQSTYAYFTSPDAAPVIAAIQNSSQVVHY